MTAFENKLSINIMAKFTNHCLQNIFEKFKPFLTISFSKVFYKLLERTQEIYVYERVNFQ